MKKTSMATITEACTVLFGPEVNVTHDFLKILQPEGVKAAYRTKALESHPDRARLLGKDEALMADHFKQVTQAYEKLITVIKGNGVVLLKPPSTSEPSSGYRRPENSRGKHSYYTGKVPNRRLLIGQFLYYARLISWQDLIAAITWQRRQRPLIGQLARQWGLLSAQDISRILALKKNDEKFGACAMRLGFLTSFNLMALLGKQRRLHCPIGAYFVEQNIIEHQILARMILRQKIHNRKIATERFNFH